MGERWIKWKPWLVFGLVTGIWIAGITIPFYPQILFDVPANDNPYLGIAGAVIGAGPFILYVIYDEYVNAPRFVITTEEDEDGVEGVYFDKIVMEKEDYIYPVIEAVTTIKNVGRTSISDASVRVNLSCDDPSVDEQEFYSRWTADLYGNTTDIHPGRERELVLFQAVPSQEFLDDLDIDFGDDPHQIDIEEFFALSHDSGSLPELIEDLSGSLFLQRPLNPDSEKFEYEVENVEQIDKRRFIGRNIACPDSYDVSVHLTSRDWSGSVEVGQVPIGDEILIGRWVQSYANYEPLRDALEEEGWKSSPLVPDCDSPGSE